MAFHGRMTHLTCHFSRGHFMRIVPRFVSGKGVVGGIPSPTRPCKYFFKTLSKPKSEDCLAPVFLVWSASCTDKACQEESGTRNHFPSNPSDGSSWVLRWSWVKLRVQPFIVIHETQFRDLFAHETLLLWTRFAGIKWRKFIRLTG